MEGKWRGGDGKGERGLAGWVEGERRYGGYSSSGRSKVAWLDRPTSVGANLSLGVYSVQYH